MLLSFTVKPCGQSTPAKGVKDTRGRSIFQEMLHNNDIHHYLKTPLLHRRPQHTLTTTTLYPSSP